MPFGTASHYYTGIATAGLMCMSLDDGRELRIMRDKDPLANGAMKAQKKADCWFKGPQRAFRYALHRCGLSREQAKEVKFAIRLLVMERSIADMRASAPHADAHVETDFHILDVHCRQIARHARNGVRCGLYQLQDSKRTIINTLRALRFQMDVSLRLYLPRLVQPPLRMARLSAEHVRGHVAFPELRLLRFATDRSFLAGGANVSVEPPPPDYLAVPPRVASAEDALVALRTSTAVARQLSREAADRLHPTLACKAASVMEDTVFYSFDTPSPRPPGASDAAVVPGAFWHALSERQLQSDLLAALVDAATVYMAASLSLPADDPDPILTRHRRLALMLKLYALFDVVLRVEIEPASAYAGQFTYDAESGEGVDPSFNPSLASVMRAGFYLDADSEVIGKGRAYVSWKYRVLSSLNERFLADDPGLMASMASTVNYFTEQRAHEPSPKLLCQLRYEDPNGGPLSMTPDQYNRGGEIEGRLDAMYDFIPMLLDALDVDQKKLVPKRALTKNVARSPPSIDDPRKLFHFYKTAGWWVELQRLVPEFGRLIAISVLYKLAFKLATTDGRWLPRGKILSPSMANVTLTYRDYHIDEGGKHDVYFECYCCDRLMKPMEDARPHSFISTLIQAVQLQGGENPAVDAFTEDSVLYSQALPTFDATISEEDSEALLSSLAVNRLRVPLVLDFFAFGRIGSLLNESLQRLLSGAMFELGPIRANASDVTVFPSEDIAGELATPCGLLLSEMEGMPSAVLAPLEWMVTAGVRAGSSMSYRAPYVHLMLFITLIAARTLSFVAYVAERNQAPPPEAAATLMDVVERQAVPLLLRWVSEAAASHKNALAATITRHVAFAHAIFARFRTDLIDVEHTLGGLAFCEAWEVSSKDQDVGGGGGSRSDTRAETMPPSGVKLSFAELCRAYQHVRVKFAALVDKTHREGGGGKGGGGKKGKGAKQKGDRDDGGHAAPVHEALARVLVSIAGHSVGTDGSELGGGGEWFRLDPRARKCSACCFASGGGILLVDVGAGRVLVNRSSVQPTPKKFITDDFIAFFGRAVPNCVVVSDRIHCTRIQLWHQSVSYIVECWSPLHTSATTLEPGLICGELWGSGTVILSFEHEQPPRHYHWFHCNRRWANSRQQLREHHGANGEALIEHTTERAYSGRRSVKLTNLSTEGHAEFRLMDDLKPRVPIGVEMRATAQVFCTAPNSDETYYTMALKTGRDCTEERVTSHACWDAVSVPFTMTGLNQPDLELRSHGKDGIAPCYIDAIRFDEVDKSHLTHYEPFKLSVGEYITGVTAAHCTSHEPEGYVLRRLQLTTSAGRTSPFWGADLQPGSFSLHTAQLSQPVQRFRWIKVYELNAHGNSAATVGTDLGRGEVNRLFSIGRSADFDRDRTQ